MLRPGESVGRELLGPEEGPLPSSSLRGEERPSCPLAHSLPTPAHSPLPPLLPPLQMALWLSPPSFPSPSCSLSPPSSPPCRRPSGSPPDRD